MESPRSTSNTSGPNSPRPNPAGRVATSKTKRYLVAVGLLAGAMTLGAVFSPVDLAGAQSDESDATTEDSNSGDSADIGAADGSTDSGADNEMYGKGRLGRGGFGRHNGERGEALAEILGISVDELQAGRAEGKTLAQMAEEQGIAVEALTQELLALANTHFDEAVDEGHLTRDEADKKLAGLEEQIEDHVNQVPGENGGDHHRGEGRGHQRGGRGGPGSGLAGPGMYGPGADLGALADGLGLSLDELKTAVAGGQTLAEAAAEQGVSESDLVAALVGEASSRIDEAVAAGRLDTDRAAEITESLEERITGMVNAERPDGSEYSGRRGGQQGRRGPGRSGFHGPQSEGSASDDGVEDSSFTA